MVIYACGWNHTIAIKSNGTLWAWGANHYGQLGDGTVTGRSIPAQLGLDTDWKEAATGYGHTLALKTNGTLWSWGYNHHGELGNGTQTDSYSPTQIGVANDWKTVKAGKYNSCALKSNGTLWWWGHYFPTIPFGVSVPTQIGLEIYEDIAVGYYYGLGIKSDNTIWGWGHNAYGNLGVGNTIPAQSPVQVLCPTASVTENNLQKIKIYPYPAKDYINIIYPGSIDVKQISLIDVSGKVVMKQQDNFHQVPVSNLSSGLYLITIESEQGVYKNKVIIE